MSKRGWGGEVNKIIGFLHHGCLYLMFALMGVFLFASWGIGYYANALFGCKFELQSCWSGLSTVFSTGVLAAIKYIADSKFNSREGELPFNNDK